MRKVLLISLLLLLCVGCTGTELQPQKSEQLLLHVPSPDWRDQVIYFSMTDRFNDGDSNNNDQGAGEYNPKLESHYNGGDLQGVVDQLDYLQGLGITALWLTPIVENQWWSEFTNYGGYHGYWATDFSKVDPHLGTMATYQQLSDQLHRRDMYLIQDIVVNHTGNFFGFHDGQQGYNPDNSADNFILLESENSKQPAPTQSPFDLIDRLNPQHAAADIYHWTPPITDYRNRDHQFTYQLGNLADLNTGNPRVVKALKQTYADWIRNAGVDAFRIDTVRYVEHDFFHHFMHDADGIHAAARETGRDHFLAFGEVFETSPAYQNDAEKSVASYYGSKEKPELNSLISFPLHRELRTVFAQGFPTDHLAYRIEQHMQQYVDPYTVPTFIDNHDMARFLSSGNKSGLKQALAAIFTIPGIPTIYQGTEQAMTESRQAMFKGGYNADRDYFDTDSEFYQFIKSLAALRTGDKIYTRGDLSIVASDKTGPGVLAYTRSYEGRTVLVMFNTSNLRTLVNNTKIADQSAILEPVFGIDSPLQLDANGSLTSELEPKSIAIAEIKPLETEATKRKPKLEFTSHLNDDVYQQDIKISGISDFANDTLLLVKNRNLDTATPINTDAGGEWQILYPLENLGEETVSLLAYHPATKTVSTPLIFKTKIDTPQIQLQQEDPHGDNVGLNGNVLPPQHSQSKGQMDIAAVSAQVGGEVLKLSLTMRELTDGWIPENGFDNVAFSLFFDTTDDQGLSELPMLNASMPDNKRWDIGHVIFGWGNTTFSSEEASADHQGERFGVAPEVSVDKAKKQITFIYRAADFGIPRWQGSYIYLTTWDITGEGVYREIETEKSDWNFSSASHGAAKILDAVEIQIPES